MRRRSQEQARCVMCRRPLPTPTRWERWLGPVPQVCTLPDPVCKQLWEDRLGRLRRAGWGSDG